MQADEFAENNMGILNDRLAQYTLPQEYMEKGVYPYFRTINSHQDTEVEMDGKRILMFGSNAYLGLTYDRRIMDVAIAATEKYGTGCAGSRFLNGTLDIHVQLEKELAAFVGKEDALCFSTGFTVNEGIIPALVGRNDYIICDDRDHASIVDGVFSMEGVLANLPEIVRLKKKYDACIYVDEAHGLGVFGKNGRGVCDHFGVTDDIDLIMGTFSKSLASIGGFVAGNKEIINWLKHTARSYIFQASSTPAATAAAIEALHILQTEPERIQALWDITNYALERFREAGFEIGETESPIIPLYVRDTEKTFIVTKMAFDEGIFINPVIPPACAPDDTLVRVALMATHTKEQVDTAVEKLTKCFKQLGILK